MLGGNAQPDVRVSLQSSRTPDSLFYGSDSSKFQNFNDATPRLMTQNDDDYRTIRRVNLGDTDELVGGLIGRNVAEAGRPVMANWSHVTPRFLEAEWRRVEAARARGELRLEKLWWPWWLHRLTRWYDQNLSVAYREERNFSWLTE